jgi:DNA-binding response OmpR family regulator
VVKILAMDNEEDILSSLRTILEKEKYQVTCVTTGQSAIKEVRTGKFDLAILDVMMPDLSGWDVFDQIMRTNPKQKIMFLSVLELSPERKMLLERHKNVGYMMKPFDRSVLVDRVKWILGTSKRK